MIHTTLILIISLLSAPPASAAGLVSLTRTAAVPTVQISPILLAQPGLTQGPGAAMTLTAPVLSPLPSLAAAPAVTPVAASAVEPILAQPAAVAASAPELPAISPALLAHLPSLEASGVPKSLEASLAEGAALFDGAARRKAAALPAEDPADASAWKKGRFKSPADGGELRYQSRKAAAPAAAAPTVFIGGIAPDLSYESYFETQKPAGDQYFLHLRAHSPSPWTYTRTVIDADARDLAHMIVMASRQSASRRVDLVLHSYGGMLFERMVQMRSHDYPEVKDALRLLKNGRVTVLDSTTHFADSEAVLGEQYAILAQGVHAFIDWLNEMDSLAEIWERTAQINPFLAPVLQTQLLAWRLEREQLLVASTSVGVDTLLKKLGQPWDPAVDRFRLRLLKAVQDGASRPGWREALLRRSDDTLRLEFTKKDVEFLRRYKMRINLVHARRDTIVPWVNARLLFTLLGIPAPQDVPPAGSVLRDPSGLFQLTVVEGDHMFPVTQPALLGALLAP
jgi:hypothetical protein